MKNVNGKSYWEKTSGIYDFIIKKDKKAYEEMYSLIRKRLNKSMEVLELATGTGLIAVSVAEFAKTITATDFSPKMIAEAKKKYHPNNVTFSVQDACALPYKNKSYDAVIISNALHIMPNPQKALSEISRVLKDDGVLIAPCFVHKGSRGGMLLSYMLELFTKFPANNRWTKSAYCDFLSENGFKVNKSIVLKASFQLCYTECNKNNSVIFSLDMQKLE